uniref:NADH dehydrogenase subunit 5 n=1 Tax=Diopatra cuprea TaxID=398472 RepID=UPI001D105220|nr:NADH dehydrogenase subunit 5 [Diopatra cuprea]QZM06614.1 NADH dehydrogenase subunit 5 [Diopatra cuprea]
MFMLSSPKKMSLFIWSILILIIIPLSFIHLISMKSSILEWTLLSMNSFHITIPFIFDPQGLIFSSSVLIISASIMHFSESYMKHDPFLKRFIHLVILFILSMNMLIFIPHLMILLLGWDGLGITSFILVIYYQNPKSLAAGMITALTNRIGDVMILLAIAWSFNQAHWNILNMSFSSFSPFICLTIFIAGLTKSAQIPFSSWLPAAMAAPTPVSALVHSSTLVTAGVFLFIRFYSFLSLFSMFSKILLIVASMTMLMAGISAMMECDMKKIIALSTLSQLGVMMSSLAMNLPMLTFFHLITHAMFKALLFMCAGSLINLHSHSQDLRSMGNLSNQMPLLTSSMIIANAALCGTPFMAGFYSKDMIIELSLYNMNNFIIILMYIFATILTTSYSIRFLLSTIWAPSISTPLHSTNDLDLNISIPTLILTLAAIFMGSLINWIFISPQEEPILILSLKLLPILCIISGLLLLTSSSYYMSSPKSILISLNKTHNMNSMMWFLTPISSQAMIKIPLIMSHKMYKIMDQGWNETMGGQGSLIFSNFISSKIINLQDNLSTLHILLTFILFIPLILL